MVFAVLYKPNLKEDKLNKLMYYFLYRDLESARSDSHYVTEVYNLLNLNKEIGIYFASASRAFATDELMYVGKCFSSALAIN